MKKYLLLSALAFAALGMNAATEIGGLYYNLSGTNAALVRPDVPDVTYTGDIVVPSSVVYGGTTYTVNEISTGAFEFSTVTSVKLPDTKLQVKGYAFDTSTIKTIWLGTGTDLSGNAISSYCSGLQDLYCPYTTVVPQLLAQGVNSNLRKQVALHIPADTFRDYQSQGWTNFLVILQGNQIKVDQVCYDLYDDGTAKIMSPFYMRGDEVAINEYTIAGDVVIPDFVSYEGKEYEVTKMDNECFYLSDLTSIQLPAGLKEVTFESFYAQNGLTSIVIPDGVTKICHGAFADCGSLKEITLGKNVELLEGITGTEGMFAWVPLTKITSLATTPPEVGSPVFFEGPTLSGYPQVNQYQAELLVPESALEAYKAHPVWSKFTNIKAIQIPAEELILSETEVTLTANGQTYDLSYEVRPADTTDSPIWSSSNDNVVTVNNGTLTAVANGTAVVTLTMGDLSATCNVTVSINSGVATISIDSASVRYYNLQGVEIDNPAKGQIVIVRQGDKTFKTVIK